MAPHRLRILVCFLLFVTGIVYVCVCVGGGVLGREVCF